MKKIFLFLIAAISFSLFGQSNFSTEDYKAFLESNKTLTTEDLLNLYPPPSTYYKGRANEPRLSDIPWYDAIDSVFEFTEDEKGLLRQNYFFATERVSFPTWENALLRIYNMDLPVFISSDFILYTLHQSYDEILKQMEYLILEPNLQVLLSAMKDQFHVVYEKYKDIPELSHSLEDVDLYLAVANSLLLNIEVQPVYADTAIYNDVMTAIQTEQMVEMPLFTRKDLYRKLDFSQLVPRGHYTEEFFYQDGVRTLENYFRSMMWLGRIDFLMTPPPDDGMLQAWTREDIIRMNFSALILNDVLQNCGEKGLYDFHEGVISFLVGPSDNLTPDELNDLNAQKLVDITDLLDNEVYNEYMSALESNDDYGQKILSDFFYVDSASSEPGGLPVSFKLFGQKFLIDSYIFSQVVFNNLEYDGVQQMRMMPDPLDILAVFGNENAMALMKPEMEKYHYAYKINELKYLTDSYDEAFWSQSLYNTWLASLLALNPHSEMENLPYFMQTTAWQHEKLNTQLGSWAQLRHDNLLYGKQSYTGGASCSFPYAYVEPYPDFYNQLASFAENAAAFFGTLQTVNNDWYVEMVTDFYSRYSEIMLTLEALARKEVSGEVFNSDDLTFLKSMLFYEMSCGASITGWINDLLVPAMGMWEEDYTIADVHTQPTDEGGNVVGKVLHVGYGKLNLGVFIAPKMTEPSKKMCYVGPLASFHTKVESNFKRLNDEEWKEMALVNSYSYRPDWVYAYLADEKGKHIQPENVLKGDLYTGTDIIPEEGKALQYILAYPNPAIEKIHFRFILSVQAMVEAEIYDISGRKILEIFSTEMPAAEHDLDFSVEDWLPGIYFLRMKVNGESHMKRFLVQ